MLGSRIRKKLRSGQPVLNVGVTFHSPLVVEWLGLSDIDTVYLDAEHGSINESQCEEMVRAAFLVDKPALVRVPHNDPHTILRYLDIGTSGIIAPHVANAEQVRQAVDAAKYAPMGHRSFGPARFFSRRPGQSVQDYIRQANEETLVIGLFEDIAALEHLDEMTQTPGLDALVIGTSDLSFSMGYTGQSGHPEVQKVVDKVIAACHKAGIATGLPASSVEQARDHIARGAQIISLSFANLVIESAQQFVTAVRSG